MILKVTLYVKGVRIKQLEDRSRADNYVAYPMNSGPRLYPDYRVYKETTYKSVLSEDQKVLVERVKALAVKYHFELKVIDVGENRFLDKMKVRFEGISGFPTLIADNGLRIVGDITEERIKGLVFNRAENRRGVVRAF